MNRVEVCRHGTMLYSDNDAYVGKSLGYYGEYSEAEYRILEYCIKCGDLVVEVGANIGALTVPLARKVGPKGMVFAFEPQRMTYYALCGSIFLNELSNVFCFQRALGDTQGVAMIPDLNYSLPGNYGAFSLLNEEPDLTTKVPVEVNRLDDFGIQSCQLLKVDVEGMELAVLRGAITLISRHRPILYIEDDRDEQRDELRDWIADQGYELWQHFPPLYSENNYLGSAQNQFENCVSANILAWHKNSGVRREDFAQFDLKPGDIKFAIKH